MFKLLKDVGNKISDAHAEMKRKGHARLLGELRTYQDVIEEEDFSGWPDDLSDLPQAQLDALYDGELAKRNLQHAKERRARNNRLREVEQWFADVLDVPGAVLKVDTSKCLSKAVFRPYYQELYNSKTQGLGRGRAQGLWAAFEPPTLERPISDLSSRELAALKACAIFYAHAGEEKMFEKDKAMFAWGEGRGFHGESGEYGWLVEKGCSVHLEGLAQLVNHRLGEVKQVMTDTPESRLAKVLSPLFSQGQAWAEHIAAPFCPHVLGETMMLGLLNGREPIGFAGNESLLTIGGPGSGKTQAHVIPNVLTYRGSVIVLDVKGEVFRATAGYRQDAIGSTVYRFSLMKDGGAQHRYNPLDLISRDEDEVFDDAHRMAQHLIPHPPQEKDPFWVNSARDLVAAVIAAVIIDPDVEEPNFTAVLDRLMTAGNNRLEMLERVAVLGRQAGIRQLTYAGETLVSLAQESERTFESIVQHARQALAPIGSPLVERATKTSDWTPEDLRKSGASLYIAVPQDKIEFFPPLLRLILAQHLDALMRVEPEQQGGSLPLTLFLDELPQLGNFEPVVKAIELGRGYGIRVWGFAQNPQQIERSYERASVILDSVAVRSFLSIDLPMAEQLSRSLGETVNLITEEKQPLATPAALLGPDFKDRAVILGRNCAPINASMLQAWQVHEKELNRPYVDTVAAAEA